jgi:outer membrane autotransporter protein
VAGGIDNAINSGGGFLAGLANVAPAQIPAALDALSGAGTTGTQETALGAGNMVLNAMTEQGRTWLNSESGYSVGGGGAGALNYASEKRRQHPALKAIPLKAPVAEPPRWRTWAVGFDGSWKLAGETGIGSSDLSHHTAGGAGGFDYQVNPDLLVGFAAGGSTSGFSVPALATSGSVDGAHLGVYSVARAGTWYTAGALTAAAFDNHTSRTIAGVGPTELATASFRSDLFAGRFEVGHKQAFDGFAITPFAAVQFAELWQQGYTESSLAPSGPGVLGLSFQSHQVSSLPTFLGAQFDTHLVLPSGMLWAPYARVSWVHEFEPSRDITASFLTLANSTFTVDGPRAARDAARIDVGSKLAITRNVSLFGTFNGEFSDRSQLYSGNGGLRVVW